MEMKSVVNVAVKSEKVLFLQKIKNVGMEAP